MSSFSICLRPLLPRNILQKTHSRSFATASPPPASEPNTHFRITLRRSAIALGERKKETLTALGLHRRMQTVYHAHTSEAAGKILKVKELVEVENVPAIKYFSPTTNLCIIRVARDQHTLAWGAVTLLSSINGSQVIPHVVHVSGTIKHVQLAAIKHNREVVARFRARAKTPALYHTQDSYVAYLAQSTREIEALQE
ncbi:hypothetical protein PAXINDRAFT_116069 [Paxillus involutus ATCC 200175]|uniref:Large ribosomal subunit protein uL30m n=1 Tax=Paxillus involutus ATCC 200175 TaxID=664439 RepID=A0A0C9U4L7_PAXIN|nr:hypothetical protein PAXINDRAFT_116069 [Paxillus involutus ATCC 200175]